MKTYLLFLFSLITCILNSQTPDFSIYGYASMLGGTNGGATGDTVTPTTFDELQTYASGTSPYIILIDREFKGPNVLKMGSNKSLLGVGDKAFINQIGISIQCQHNIIIRNIRFTMTGVPITKDGENKIEGFRFDPDCIAIQADDDNLPLAERKSHHIWIDHCEFYNEDPTVMTDYDRYDGLVDVKNDCQYITISWCYFHDHHKACLSGKGSSDKFDRKTTMHHNKFENIKSRMPLQRFGKLHYFNNYVVDCPAGDGVSVRINAQAYIEKNYFDNTKKPVFGKLSEEGKAHLIDNKFINCSRLLDEYITSSSPKASALSASETFEDCDYVPPYIYKQSLDSVETIPTVINKWVGINKISSKNNDSDNTSDDISNSDNANPDNSNPDNSTTLKLNNGVKSYAYVVDRQIYAVSDIGSSIKIYNINGQIIYSTVSTNDIETFSISEDGFYILHINNKAIKLVVRQ